MYARSTFAPLYGAGGWVVAVGFRGDSPALGAGSSPVTDAPRPLASPQGLPLTGVQHAVQWGHGRRADSRK